jgi:hypothetical protein
MHGEGFVKGVFRGGLRFPSPQRGEGDEELSIALVYPDLEDFQMKRPEQAQDHTFLIAQDVVIVDSSVWGLAR